MHHFFESDLIKAIYSLGSNFAVVITAMLVFILLREGKVGPPSRKWQLILGFWFGLFCIVSILAPIHVRQGIIIDAKYPLTAISTIYGGPLAGVVTATISGISRAFLGGNGVYAAIPTLIFSWLLGLAFRRWSNVENSRWMRLLDFLMLGFGLVMLQLLGGLVFLHFYPWDEVKSILIDRTIPALAIYPPMTVLLGLALDFMNSRNDAVLEKNRTLRQLEIRNQELQVLNYTLHHDLRTRTSRYPPSLTQIQFALFRIGKSCLSKLRCLSG